MNASSLNTSALIRPAWTPATIAMMIIGFMLFWPLGLGMLAYILWGERLDSMKTDINRATDSFAGNFNRSFGCRGRRSHRSARTGNVAFDDWREEEISRLEEERRKLDEMRHEFDEHLRELRRAKDQSEFDDFMNSRKSKSSEKRNKSVPDSKSGNKGKKD